MNKCNSELCTFCQEASETIFIYFRNVVFPSLNEVKNIVSLSDANFFLNSKLFILGFLYNAGNHVTKFGNLHEKRPARQFDTKLDR